MIYFQKLRFKLITTVIAIVCFSFLITFFVSIMIMNDIITSMGYDNLEMNVHGKVNIITNNYEYLSKSGVYIFANQVERIQNQLLTDMGKEGYKESGFFCVFNSQKELVSHPDSVPEGIGVPILTAGSPYLDFSHKGVGYVGYRSYFDQWDWFVCLIIKKSEFFRLRLIMIRFFTIIIVTTLLILLLFLRFFIKKTVLEPINRIIKKTDRIKAGSFDRQLVITSRDEMGELAENILIMEKALDTNFTILESQKQELAELNKNLEAKVTERTEELQSVHTAMMEGISYARKIQEAILPYEKLFRDKMSDYFIIWKPRDIVGGDFYWYTEQKNAFMVALIDCTGHGVPGAFMSLISNALLNYITSEVCYADPACILEEVHTMLVSVLHQDNEESLIDDGMDAALCYIDPGEKKITFAGARHSFFYHNGNKLVEIAGDKQSIGYQRGCTRHPFTNHTIQYRTDYQFYLTSDGYTSQMGNAHQFPLGKKNFRQILEKNISLPFGQQKEALMNYLEDYREDSSQIDDITVIGFAVKE